MEDNFPVLQTVNLLLEKTNTIYKRQIEQLQGDENTLKEIINQLAAECSLLCTSTTKGEEKIMKDYQKAREDRDEYKFKIGVYENKIKALEEELSTLKSNQMQQSFSVNSVDTMSKLNNTNAQINAEVENSRMSRASPENLNRELQYLHKKNQEFHAEIRRLKLNLKSQTELNDKLCSYEEEISSLKSVIDSKNTKIMDLQIESEEKLKKAKLEYEFMLSSKMNLIDEMHKTKCDLQISLQEAREEIKLMKQLHLNQTTENSEGRNPVISTEKGNILQSDITVSGHSTPKLDVLHGINVRTKTKQESNLRSIENINTEDISVIEKRQEKLDEVCDLPAAAEFGMARGRNARKASKNATAEIKKQAEISLENAEKVTKPKQRKRAKGNTKTARTEKNTVSNNSEVDENADPSSLASSRSLVQSSYGKEKQSKSRLPVTKNPVIKETDNSSKQTHRRKNL